MATKGELLNWQQNTEQDGQLSPAFFSPNYKYFDQFLQTVINKTTVLILVFEECLQTTSTTPSVLYAKRYQDFPLKIFRLTVPKKFGEEPFCVSQKICHRKMLGVRGGGGINIFRRKVFVPQCRKIFVAEPFSVSENFR